MDGLMNEWVNKLLTVARIFWMRFAHKTVYVHSMVLLITGLELYRTVPLGNHTSMFPEWPLYVSPPHLWSLTNSLCVFESF